MKMLPVPVLLGRANTSLHDLTSACLLSFLLFPVQPALGQNPTKASYQNARQVLEASVTAYGGIDDLRSIRNFTINMTGEMGLRNQSRRPFLLNRAPFQLEVAVDLKSNRSRELQQGSFAGGSTYHGGAILHGSDGVEFDLIRKTSKQLHDLPSSAIRDHLFRLPQFVVLSAIEHASSLRDLGQAEFDRRPHHILSYLNEDGQQTSLYFDENTHLLTKYETLGTDVFFGDVVFETIFTGYRRERRRPIPMGRITKTDGDITEEVRYNEVAFNTDLPDGTFVAPANLRSVTDPTPQPISQLAENVYLLNTFGYNHPFFVFQDHILVMEAPGGDAGSRAAIELIKKTVPGMPIRYLVLTHHHDDHAGGFRTYVAEGATLVAATGERTFFEKAAETRSTISSDALMRVPKPVKVETVSNGKRVFTDAATTVEVYNIGSNPHTEEMLIAYLPKEKLLFEADLLNRPANGDEPIATAGTVYLAQWIEANQLAVDKIYLVHGTPTTMDELRRAVGAKKQ